MNSLLNSAVKLISPLNNCPEDIEKFTVTDVDTDGQIQLDNSYWVDEVDIMVLK